MNKSKKLLISQATIANTETVSNAIDISGACIVGFVIPASFDGANITFQAATSFDGTYRVLRQGDTIGAVVTIKVTANTYIAAPYDEMQGLQFIKIVSDVAMTANRVIEVIAR